MPANSSAKLDLAVRAPESAIACAIDTSVRCSCERIRQKTSFGKLRQVAIPTPYAAASDVKLVGSAVGNLLAVFVQQVDACSG